MKVDAFPCFDSPLNGMGNEPQVTRKGTFWNLGRLQGSIPCRSTNFKKTIMKPTEFAKMKPAEILRMLVSEYKQFQAIEDKQQAAEFAGGDDWDEANQVYQEEIAFWESVV